MKPQATAGGAPDAGAKTTLVLSGDLDRTSVHQLEVELERLCESDANAITLDLRQLSSIDWTGMMVIAFRCGLCRKRGYELTLIPGPEAVQRAFDEAGLLRGLPFEQAQGAAVEEPLTRTRSRSSGAQLRSDSC